MPGDGSPSGWPWCFFRGSFSDVSEFLLMPVRISHFQLLSMEAILGE